MDLTGPAYVRLARERLMPKAKDLYMISTIYYIEVK